MIEVRKALGLETVALRNCKPSPAIRQLISREDPLGKNREDRCSSAGEPDDDSDTTRSTRHTSPELSDESDIDRSHSDIVDEDQQTLQGDVTQVFSEGDRASLSRHSSFGPLLPATISRDSPPTTRFHPINASNCGPHDEEGGQAHRVSPDASARYEDDEGAPGPVQPEPTNIETSTEQQRMLSRVDNGHTTYAHHGLSSTNASLLDTTQPQEPNQWYEHGIGTGTVNPFDLLVAATQSDRTYPRPPEVVEWNSLEGQEMESMQEYSDMVASPTLGQADEFPLEPSDAYITDLDNLFSAE